MNSMSVSVKLFIAQQIVNDIKRYLQIVIRYHWPGSGRKSHILYNHMDLKLSRITDVSYKFSVKKYETYSYRELITYIF